jgi:uncharacterized glyoxalase superfamily protein PhnB
MAEIPAQTRSTIIPCLRYRDAHAAIDWLCKASGFQKQVVYNDDRGGVAHAQLTYGGGMLMLGSVRDDGFGQHIVQPEDVAARETQCPCVIVDPYQEKDYGGAGHSCRDPEGHLWWLGGYNPWQETRGRMAGAALAAPAAAAEPIPRRPAAPSASSPVARSRTSAS